MDASQPSLGKQTAPVPLSLPSSSTDRPSPATAFTRIHSSVLNTPLPSRMPRKDANSGPISAQAQQDLVSEGIENFELPKTVVTKIAKSAVSRCLLLRSFSAWLWIPIAATSCSRLARQFLFHILSGRDFFPLLTYATLRSIGHSCWICCTHIAFLRHL